MIMMERFLTFAVLFVWMLVVGCRPTVTGRKNETRNNALNTIAPKTTKVITTKVVPPTSYTRVQRSTVPSRKTTATATRVILSTVAADPIQTDLESTRDSPFAFLTSDVRKLNILVVALAAVLMVLMIVIVILGILRRSMQRKMQRMKDEKDETITTDAEAIAQYRETPLTESRFYNVETTHQPVEYEVPYAHQQAMTVKVMALANQNPTNNNLSNQIAPNRLPITSMADDDDDYVNPRVIEAIVEESKTADQTIENDTEYKIPRNATKRAGLIRNETLTNTSTLKDSRGYVIMANYAGPVEDHAKNSHNGRVEGRKHHVYDVPAAKTGRSADTFSRKTIKTKIKIFQEKLKSDKSKPVLPAENEKGTQKDFARESVVQNTAYDDPRKM